MRRLLILLSLLAILGAPVTPVVAGICHPPKLEKMIKPPCCKKGIKPSPGSAAEACPNAGCCKHKAK